VPHLANEPEKARHHRAWYPERMGLRISVLCKLLLGSNGLVNLCGVVAGFRSLLLLGRLSTLNVAVGAAEAQTL